MTSFDASPLPRTPLSMGVLLALDPPALRRLLKGGLRLGLRAAELEELLRHDWQLEPGSPEAEALLEALRERGWLLWHPETERWKTHFG
ncbi:MAG: hypothetical protein VKJ66_11130 [Synechococcus sp.]|nr:hypothetical protein [Synechococcus sp.]